MGILLAQNARRCRQVRQTLWSVLGDRQYSHLSATPLASIAAPWPFMQWGMDILSPFIPALGQRKFLPIAIDYFTKWVKVELLAKITEARVMDFIWKSIICRFDLPRVLITNNGCQYSGSRFTEFYRERGISQYFTSIGHLQANSEAEVINQTLLQGLKVRIDRAKEAWMDELYSIL